MEYNVTSTPGSALEINLRKGESVIAEKGVFLYGNGLFEFHKEYEIRQGRSWLAAILGSKSMSYNKFASIDNVSLVFAPEDNAEIVAIPITNTNAVFIEADSHLARYGEITLELKSNGVKNALLDGWKLRAEGVGLLFIKGYGSIKEVALTEGMSFVADEEALLAYTEGVVLKPISGGWKSFLLSGEGFLLQVSGSGTLWLQTKKEGYGARKSGIVGAILNFFIR